MQRTLIKNITSKLGEEIKISGWIQTIRDQGSIKFLIIRDITGVIQAVVTKKENEVLSLIKGLSVESVVEIIGTPKEEKQAPGGFEIKVKSLKVLSVADSNLPIPVVVKTEQESEQQKRLDWRWLDLRKPEKALIFKVWTIMEHAWRDYLVNNGYIEIHSPKLTEMATESGSELFQVKYFDRKAYLAQSPQLYKQMAMAAGFEKVFEVGPVFRANPSFTSRHDTEFTMYDVEMSFIESHFDLMEEEERMIVAMLKNVKDVYGREIKDNYGRELIVPTIPFPKIPLREAKKILAKMGVPNERGEDLSPEEERSICEYVKKEYGHEFVFIHDWPASVRAFYSMKLESDNSLSKTFDLLWNGLEITSGAQREHRYDILLNQIKGKGYRVESFQSYLNFFKYGCPPHGGFAPGPTRMLMKVFNINNVREVTYLYRGVNRLSP